VPTYAVTAQFFEGYDELDWEQRHAFRVARQQFCADLEAGSGFRKGLRVKGVRGAKGVFEMTWAPDGRATFEYGKSQRDGHAHIIWRRIGTHAIFRAP